MLLHCRAPSGDECRADPGPDDGLGGVDVGELGEQVAEQVRRGPHRKEGAHSAARVGVVAVPVSDSRHGTGPGRHRAVGVLVGMVFAGVTGAEVSGRGGRPGHGSELQTGAPVGVGGGGVLPWVPPTAGMEAPRLATLEAQTM